MGQTVVGDYFGRINEGGANASRGFSYQDLCAIGFLFDFIENKKFVSLTVEQINDFTILLSDEELVCQVKDYKISKKDVVAIQNGFRDEEKNKYAIISPAFTRDIASLQQKKKEFFQACDAGRERVQCDSIKQQLEKKVKEIGMTTNVFWKCEFVSKSLDDQEEVVLYKICKWRELSKYEFDENVLLDRLSAFVTKLRNKRGAITRNDVIDLARESKITKDLEGFVCSMLNHKEGVLAELNRMAEKNRGLRKDLKLIIAYIETDEYEKAIKEVINVCRDFPVDMRIYHAWLALMLDDFLEVKKICDSILIDGDNNQSTALFYKGVVEYKKKNYAKSYKFMKRSEALSTELCYEQQMYLAKLEVKLKKDLQKAKGRLERCLDLKCDDWEAYYFLACISRARNSIELLKKAVLYTKQVEPRILLAEIYRIVEEDELAYNEYKVIFSDLNKIENWRLLQGMVYCLINLGRLDEAETHLLTCLNSFISSKENIIKDHKTMVIFDLTMNDIKLLTCTRENNLYKFSSPIGDYCIPAKCSRSMKNKDGVGVMIIPSLEWGMTENEQFKIHIKNVNKVIPYLVANYDNDYAFLNKIGMLSKEGIADLYQEGYGKVTEEAWEKILVDLKKGDMVRYQEYYVKKEDVHIKIYEYREWMKVDCRFCNVLRQTSTFKKGDGYFEFKKELEKKEGYISWYLYSIYRKQLIDLNIPKECVEIEYC